MKNNIWNFELKVFNIRDNNFAEKYYAWLKCLEEYVCSRMEIISDSTAREINKEDYFIEEYYKMEQHQFPKFLKDFMTAISNSRFYKKSADKLMKCLPEYAERYCTLNWQTNTGSRRESIDETMYNIMNYGVNLGIIEHYQSDTRKAICIDWECRKVWIERGWKAKCGYEPLVNTYKTPKYMQPLIDKLFIDYDNWMKE